MKISSDQIIKTQIFPASRSELWQRFTTREGLLTFFGVDNNIELEIGGAYEIYFLMDLPEGSRGSEGCKVLSYNPESSLTISWNAPPNFPEIRNSLHYTWLVIDFYSINENNTELILTHAGWPEDGSWTEVYQYFDAAWNRVFDSLRESLQ